MISYRCDKCGQRLEADDPQRFVARLEVFAAVGPLQFTTEELARDHTEEIRDLIRRLKDTAPDEAEDQTYRCFRFDLCRACHGALLKRPLG